MPVPMKTLVYGYGNVGRKDDGLGVLCALEIEKWLHQEAIAGVVVETNYQLNIEDAETISKYDVIYFVDASLEAIKDVSLTKVIPDDNIIEFSMHAISPAYVLKLCSNMFGKKPKVNLVHIKGYEWDFSEGTSKPALKNLASAIKLLQAELGTVSQAY